MESKFFIVFSLICATLSTGCSLAGGGRNVAPGQLESVTSFEDDIYRRFPQLLTLEQKLDRASAYFYFGERELASLAAEDLIENVADLKKTSPDSIVCDHLDYLEDGARCLLKRITDDVIEKEMMNNVTALIDSAARGSIVEEEIEIEYNPKTTHWIRYFQGSGRKHFSRWLARTAQFKGIIEPILVEVGIPRDLLYLAVIESGLNMGARSRMKAIGPWQFMSGTARLFGVRINWWLDERKDIIASTYAAANYLKYLHDLFDSWPLALASYNAGEHRVAYAMTRQRTNDYWRLRLPAQTTWFVPKFMAALAIGRNPEAYGFERPADDTIRFDLIEVGRPIELRAIAEAADCSLNDIKELNPHFKKWCTPPDMVVEVKVPAGKGDRCLARLAEMKTKRMVSFVQHKVKKGETLSHIASEYELSVKELKKFNDMGTSHTIRVGNILLIPVKDTQRPVQIASRPSYRNPEPIHDNISIPLLGTQQREETIFYVVKHDDTLVENGTKCIIHVVKKGETLSAISRLYKARLSDILGWNQKTARGKLYPGEKIKIWLKAD